MSEPLVTNLDAATMDTLRMLAQEISYDADQAIVRRGEPGRSFYVVMSGELEVQLRDRDCKLVLARLGQGMSFGEMSLLTRDPVSADVVTLGPTQVLQFSEENFQKALSVSAVLRNHVLARLSNNLRQTSSETWDLFQHLEALNALMQQQADEGPIIAESNGMAKVQNRIEEFARDSQPLLITGEPGTGKLFAAKKIHEAANSPEAPLIVVDCRQLSSETANKILFGTQEVYEFSSRSERNRASGLGVQGALHLANQGSLVLRHIDALERSVQEFLLKYIESRSKIADIYPDIRVMVTTRENLSELVEQERFSADLWERFSANSLDMPPLRKRKADILPLARRLLADQDHRHPKVDAQNERVVHQFTQGAEHALLSASYQHRNAEELREAVELAALFADGPEVNAEHIFTGPKDKGHPIEYDLGRNWLVQWLSKKTNLYFLQFLVVVFFAGITVFCLAAGSTVLGRIANTLVWVVWWPALMLIFLCIGRLWCTVCPISSTGRLIRKLGSFKWAPPSWMKNHTQWLMALGFLAIIWAEQVFHMTKRPMGTGFLLLSLVGLAILFCVLFQREVWCRYVCPLGSLGASYSVASPVSVHANPGVCASQCSTHECFKGSQTESGCPMFHHPLYARDAHFCKLCFTCLRSCPHQSARIYLRPPLQDLWRMGDFSMALVPFALVVFTLTLILLAAQRYSWAAGAFGFTVLSILGVGLAVVLTRILARLLPNEHDPAILSRVVFGLLLLAWGPFMAVHLANIPHLDSVWIYASDGSLWNRVFGSAELSVLTLLQYLIILFSVFVAGIVFWRIRARFTAQKNNGSYWGWKLLTGIALLYIVAALVLTLPRGVLV